MRVMVFVKATKDSEAGALPEAGMFEAMGKYNQQLIDAGVMVAGDGLQPTSKGKRIAFNGDKRTIIDGPFGVTNEVVAGFWVWEVKDLDEAIAWARRCPNPMPGPSELEIRPFYDIADFADVLTPEAKAILDQNSATAARVPGNF